MATPVPPLKQSPSLVQMEEEEVFTMNKETSLGTQLLNGLEDLRRDDQFCDVVIVAGAHRLKAHKVVLAAFSPYFDKLFKSGTQVNKVSEIHICDTQVPSDLVPVIVDFAYSGKLLMTGDNVERMLETAQFMNIKLIVNICVEFLTENLCVENCMKTLGLADALHIGSLYVMALNYACFNFMDVSSSDGFLGSSVHLLVDILRQEQLRFVDDGFVPIPEKQEYEIAKRVLRYIKHDVEGRREMLMALLVWVRLPTLLPTNCKDLCSEELLGGTIQFVQEAQLLGVDYQFMEENSNVTESEDTLQESSCNLMSIVCKVDPNAWTNFRKFRRNGALTCWLSVGRGAYDKVNYRVCLVRGDSPLDIMEFCDRDLTSIGARITKLQMWFDSESHRLVALEMTYTSGHIRYYGRSQEEMNCEPKSFELHEGEVITETETSANKKSILSITFTTSLGRVLGLFSADRGFQANPKEKIRRDTHKGSDPLRGYLSGIEGAVYTGSDEDCYIKWIKYRWANSNNDRNRWCSDLNKSDTEFSTDEAGSEEDDYMYYESMCCDVGSDDEFYEISSSVESDNSS